jgi:hypothetical protein
MIHQSNQEVMVLLTFALGKAETIIELSRTIAMIGRQFEIVSSGWLIDRNTSTLLKAETIIELSRRIPLVGVDFVKVGSCRWQHRPSNEQIDDEKAHNQIGSGIVGIANDDPPVPVPIASIAQKPISLA